MNIWLITIGEPVPITKDCGDRLYRTGYFAHFLSEHGHSVTWWTSTFDHFRKVHLFDQDNTIEVNHRLVIRLLYGGGYHSNFSLKRILDHKRIAKKFSRSTGGLPRPDLILCSFPTIDLSLASVRYGLEHKVPVVLDMRDMWPDIFLDLVPNSLRKIATVLTWPMLRNARAACAGATAITGITEPFIEWGIEKAGRPKSLLDRSFPMGYVSRAPVRNKIVEAEKFWDEQGITTTSDNFVVCFFGTLGRQLDLDTVLHAASKLRGSEKPFSFVICGTGDRLDHLRSMAPKAAQVIFPGWVDAAQIHVLMQRSVVGLDPMPNRYDFLGTINNKAIEYLSAGLPIISSPDCGLLSNLLKEHQCGLSYPHHDSESLAELLIRLSHDSVALKKMSENATRLYKELFMAEKVYGEMMEYLVKIAEMHKQ